MSKLKLNNINFDESDFLVEVGKEKKVKKKSPSQDDIDASKKEEALIINRAKQEASEIIEKALNEANKIKEEATQFKEDTFCSVEKEKNEIIENAKQEASEIIENAKNDSQKESQELIQKSKDEIEQQRITTIKNAYDEGYKDGLEKIQEELVEKIEAFDNICAQNYEIRDKILKSANKDILDLIINISKKVLLEEINSERLDKIIKSTISMLESKENVNIILSKKYAQILFEHQKNSLADEIEFNFEDFKQYNNFNIIFNPDFDDDTIIVENLKERFDASISSQLDVLVRNIFDNSQNGKLNLEDYENEIE